MRPRRNSLAGICHFWLVALDPAYLWLSLTLDPAYLWLSLTLDPERFPLLGASMMSL